jgi:hypothetical protein
VVVTCGVILQPAQVPSNLPFILCLESVVDVCLHHACHDTLLPVVKLAVQCVTTQYKAARTRPDLLQVLDVFCKVNAAAILDALAKKKSFEQLRHSALIFLDLLAATRRANLEPHVAKLSSMMCSILAAVQTMQSMTTAQQLSILNAVNAAARLQLMAPSTAERLVGFLAVASSGDLPPSLIRTTMINLAESPSLQPHLWPHMLNAFTALTGGGAAGAHLSHALARLSTAWAAAGNSPSWSSGMHVPSAATLLSRLFLSIMSCPAPSFNGAPISDVMNALLHCLNNMSMLLAENARDSIRSHVLGLPLIPLSGCSPTARFPTSPACSPATPLSSSPIVSFSNFTAPSPSTSGDQSGASSEVYARLWGSVVAASGSAGFAQQACDALCSYAVANKLSSRRGAEDEIIACLRLLSATAQIVITPACCRCILDSCFDIGIASSSRRVQTAACETFMSAAKLDHNEAASSLQHHVEAPTKGLLKNFLTMVDRAGGGKVAKKAQSEQARIVAFAMRICGRIFSESAVDPSLVARTHSLCGTYVMPLLERDMTRGDVTAIQQAARAIVCFVEAQGENCQWMVNDVRDSGSSGLWNYPYSISPLLQLVDAASVIIVKLASEKSSKSQDVISREQPGSDGDPLSPTTAMSSTALLSSMQSAAAATNASSITAVFSAALESAVTNVVEAARVLCSRSNSRSAPIVHSIALQFITLCSQGNILWHAVDESAAAQLLRDMSSFLCDVVALGGRNVELSIARAVLVAGHFLISLCFCI